MCKQRFRYSASILKTSHLFATIGGLLTILLGSLLLLELPNVGELDFSQLYLDEHGNVPFELHLMALCLLLGCVVAYVNRQVRLELDGENLTIHIPRLTGLGLMGFTTGDHRIPLNAIRKIELAPVTGFRNMAQALQQSKLSLVTDRQTYRLQPYHFLREGHPDHRIGIGSAFGKPKSKVETLINEAPLVRALSGVIDHVDFTSTPTDRTGPLAKHFNLLKHKGMVLQLVLLAALGTYALVDYVMLTNYNIIGELPLWPFVSTGLLAGVLGIRLGNGAPQAERIGLAGLLCVIAMAATYPGLQRYTLVVSSEPHSVAYDSTETGYFEHSHYPAIDQRESNIPEYWQSLPSGESYTFLLHESGLGFVLIDMATVYEKSREFYRTDGR
ncbi:hypothetical protein [Marinobacter algicola]|uniref:Uncharacterized protein n=1 Tax=Marinobacter algicola DG893 TaxID=443152 RepID=A6EVZ5_9GAMM|nr:hypothetical protein [Marinobacter algicola]EDM49182.1 hypothetical protein MDG893_07290 [Marinobacter algicola DG893]